jgi:hypothetical protein
MTGKRLPHAHPSGNGSLPANKLSGWSSNVARTPTASTTGRGPGLGSGLPTAAQPTGFAVLMSPEALSNNERLFPAFLAHLSDGTQGGPFASSAEKLAGWASKDKAYYPSARRWVSDVST